MEPVVMIALGIITIVAQLQNYGIDIEKHPHLKDIRVRREVDSQPYSNENKGHAINKDLQKLKDNFPLKSLFKEDLIRNNQGKNDYYQGQNGYYQGDNGYYQGENGYHQGENGFHQELHGYYQGENGYFRGKNGFSQGDNGYYQELNGYYQGENGYSIEQKGHDYKEDANLRRNREAFYPTYSYPDQASGYHSKNNNGENEEPNRNYQGYNGMYQGQVDYNQLGNGYYQKQNGFNQEENGYYQRQNDYYRGQNSYNQEENGYYQRQNGYYQGKNNFNQGVNGYGQGQNGYYLRRNDYNPRLNAYSQGQNGNFQENNGYNSDGLNIGSNGYNPEQNGYLQGQNGYLQGQNGYLQGQNYNNQEQLYYNVAQHNSNSRQRNGYNPGHNQIQEHNGQPKSFIDNYSGSLMQNEITERNDILNGNRKPSYNNKTPLTNRNGYKVNAPEISTGFQGNSVNFRVATEPNGTVFTDNSKSVTKYEDEYVQSTTFVKNNINIVQPKRNRTFFRQYSPGFNMTVLTDDPAYNARFTIKNETKAENNDPFNDHNENNQKLWTSQKKVSGRNSENSRIKQSSVPRVLYSNVNNDFTLISDTNVKFYPNHHTTQTPLLSINDNANSHSVFSVTDNIDAKNPVTITNKNTNNGPNNVLNNEDSNVADFPSNYEFNGYTNNNVAGAGVREQGIDASISNYRTLKNGPNNAYDNDGSNININARKYGLMNNSDRTYQDYNGNSNNDLNPINNIHNKEREYISNYASNYGYNKNTYNNGLDPSNNVFNANVGYGRSTEQFQNYHTNNLEEERPQSIRTGDHGNRYKRSYNNVEYGQINNQMAAANSGYQTYGTTYYNPYNGYVKNGYSNNDIKTERNGYAGVDTVTQAYNNYGYNQQYSSYYEQNGNSTPKNAYTHSINKVQYNTYSPFGSNNNSDNRSIIHYNRNNSTLNYNSYSSVYVINNGTDKFNNVIVSNIITSTTPRINSAQVIVHFGCPNFMKNISIMGRKLCIPDDDSSEFD